MKKIIVCSKPTEKTYPYLGVHSRNNLLVWFVSKEMGIALNHACEEYNRNISKWSENEFTEFEGTLTFKK